MWGCDELNYKRLQQIGDVEYYVQLFDDSDNYRDILRSLVLEHHWNLQHINKYRLAAMIRNYIKNGRPT